MGHISPWLQVTTMGMREPAGTRSTTRDGDLHGEMMVVCAPGSRADRRRISWCTDGERDRGRDGGDAHPWCRPAPLLKVAHVLPGCRGWHDPAMPSTRVPAGRGGTAFVLGGGGMLGAAEVGMLRALFERQIHPDLIVGTSVGAINGAFVAADPTPSAVDRLREVWEELGSKGIFAGSVLARVGTLMRTRTHLHPREPLRDLLTTHLSVQTFAELRVPFQCVAASIERAAEQWFTDGALIEAVLASCAVPGLLPPVELDGEHYLDGGLVHSIPVGRAVALGAETIYVLHVGRIDRPLRPPVRPWEVALVAFEIVRRHRFAADLAALPPGVTLHVLPSGEQTSPAAGDLRNLRYRNFTGVPDRIDRAYVAASRYLDRSGASEDGAA
jgi:NTE family protein